MVLLCDTYSMLYRAFHALPPLTTSKGEPTGALYGFMSLLVKLLREQKPQGVAFALDGPRPSFRRERFAEYKAHRGSMPPELRSQRARLEAVLARLEAPRFASEGFEADDVIATLARELAPREVLVVSGDRDLFQTIDSRVRVLFIGRRADEHVLYDEAMVRRRYGLAPGALPSFTALVGDDADGLPGVPGVGPKTATSWIAAHGSIDELLAHLDGVKPARLRGALRDRSDALRRDEDLARLRADVPLAGGARFASVDRALAAALAEVCVELELRSLLPRLDAIGS
jgi:DNA polymerase I